MKGSSISIKNIYKRFGAFEVLHDINISINKGEFFSLLGPSGCGKTTLLRIIAGFEQPTSGSLLMDDIDILPIPPNKRHINTVFQNYALFPHLSVFENVAFPLRLRKVGSKQIKDTVNEYLELVKLTGEANKMPHQLSGGQKQRVAIARALINQPSVLLLDEPLSALDAKLRQHMLIELDAIHDKIGITFIYVTHDQQEALSVSDRVAVFEAGRIHQIGTPAEIYERPHDRFVATFIGETNFIKGTVERFLDGNYAVINTKEAGPLKVYYDNSKAINIGDEVGLSIRPEKINISASEPQKHSPYMNILRGRVDEIIYTGFQSKYFIKAGDFLFRVFRQHIKYHLNEKDISWNDEVYIRWSADDGYIVEAGRV